MVDTVIIKVGETRCVDVGKSEETTRKIGWIIVRSKNASKVRIKKLLGLFPEKKERKK